MTEDTKTTSEVTGAKLVNNNKKSKSIIRFF